MLSAPATGDCIVAVGWGMHVVVWPRKPPHSAANDSYHVLCNVDGGTLLTPDCGGAYNVVEAAELSWANNSPSSFPNDV